MMYHVMAFCSIENIVSNTCHHVVFIGISKITFNTLYAAIIIKQKHYLESTQACLRNVFQILAHYIAALRNNCPLKIF